MKKAWEQRKLGELGSVQMNKRIFKSQTSKSGDVPFYKIGTFGKKPDAYISNSLYQDYKEKYPYPSKGDLLISASGSIGRIVEYKGQKAYYQDSNIVWLEHNNHVLNSFLKAFYQIVKWDGTEGSTIKRLYNKNILNTKIKLPKVREQEAIGILISKVDLLLSLQQRKLEQLKQLKKVMLQRLFVQNKEKLVPIIRFNNFNIQWRLNTLNGLQENVYSGLSGKTKIDFGHGDARYITYLNVHDNIIAKVSGIDKIEKDLNQNKVEKGDILFTISSEVPEEVALNSVWPSNYGKDLYLNSFCFGYRPIPGKVNPFFLSYYLRTPFLRKNVFPLAQGISRFNISKKNILNISIAIPSLEEQNSIYKLLAELDKILDQKKMNINQFKAIKKFLLQKLFI